MAKKVVDLALPDFLFCEQPIKDGSFSAMRNFILHTKSKSLIEVFDDVTHVELGLNDTVARQKFYYNNPDGIREYYTLAVHYTSIEFGIGLLEQAWKFYKEYIIWEDQQIDKL